MESLLVLHNVLMTLGDEPDDIEGVDLLEIMRERRTNAPLEADFDAGDTNNDRSEGDMRIVGQEHRRLLLEYWVDNGFSRS
jgi:hypothetical protein